MTPILPPATNLTGVVTGHVFDDVNGDGIQEPGEPNLSGVGVLVVDSLGLAQQVSTDARGSYRAVVRPGNVRVDVIEGTLPMGRALTTGNDPQIALVGPGYGTPTSPVGYGRGLAVAVTAGTTSTVVPTAGPTRGATPTPTQGVTPTPIQTLAMPTTPGAECRTLNAPVELVPPVELVIVTNMGELFFTRQLCVTVEQPVVLLGARDAESGFVVDDRIALEVARPDGTTATWSYDLSLGCTVDDPPIGPVDVSALFLTGDNVLTVRLYDACDHLEGTDGPLMLSAGDAAGAAQQIAAPLIAGGPRRREPV